MLEWDILSLNSDLEGSEVALLDAIDRALLPLVDELPDAFEQGKFPKDWQQRLIDLGIFGITAATQWGGAGCSYRLYGLVCERLEAVDSGLRSFFSVQNSLCIYPVLTYGSEAQKERYGRALIAGEQIGCFGLTEPDSGSDPGSMSTKATRTDSGWVLNGAKAWITNAPIADVAIIWAKTDAGIRGFLVETRTPGFQVQSVKHKMSLRASETGEIALIDCEVPKTALLPGSDVGLAGPLKCLTQARFGIAFGVLGVVESCMKAVLDYTKTRKQFNRPLASFQLVQEKLADMYTQWQVTRALNLQLAKQFDAGVFNPIAVSMAKRQACRVAREVTRMSRDLLGANGISLEYPVIRHLLNIESVYTYEGTDHVHTLALGRYLTGHNAFSDP